MIFAFTPSTVTYCLPDLNSLPQYFFEVPLNFVPSCRIFFSSSFEFSGRPQAPKNAIMVLLAEEKEVQLFLSRTRLDPPALPMGFDHH